MAESIAPKPRTPEESHTPEEPRTPENPWIKDASAAIEDEELKNPVTQDDLEVELSMFLSPFAQDWLWNGYSGADLLRECTEIIQCTVQDHAKSYLGEAEELTDALVMSRNKDKRTASISNARGSITEQALLSPKDVSLREGSISRQGQIGESTNGNAIPKQRKRKTNQMPILGGSLSVRSQTTTPDEVSLDAISFAPRSLRHKKGFQLIAPALNSASQSRPPLSSIPRSWSGYLNDSFQLQPLAPVPEVDSPSKSDECHPKDHLVSASPAAASTTATSAPAQPEVGKLKGLGQAAFAKIVSKWESMIEKKRR